MGTIQIKNISFRYPGMERNLFEHLSITLNDTWRLGLVGRNGRGKTTFLKLLQHQVSGSGQIMSNVHFNYFPEQNVDQDATVMQMMIKDGGEGWQAEIELSKIGIDQSLYDHKFETFSGGEKTKVLLSKGFMNKNDFPLIDEPTNHLDIEGRQQVGEYLRHKQGFICISHDEAFLNLFVDHVMALNRTTVDLVAGDVDSWQTNKQFRDQEALTRDERIQKSIHKLQVNINHQKVWAQKRESESIDSTSRAHATKLMARAKQFENRRDKQIEKRKGLLNDIYKDVDLHTNIQGASGNQLMLSLRSFTIERDGQRLFEPIDLDFYSGQRLALAGANGVGKTTLLEMVLGLEKLSSSGYQLNDLPSNISYLSQDPFQLLQKFEQNQQAYDRTTIWNIMHQLGVARARLRVPMSEWSQGEAKKAALAISMSQPHQVLIWDEPTNYLDITARQKLIKLIQENKPTMIIVDHDLKFVQSICTNVQTLRPSY